MLKCVCLWHSYVHGMVLDWLSCEQAQGRRVHGEEGGSWEKYLFGRKEDSIG